MPKIILSKKGFDSSYGNRPSIILGKRLISMPIPDAGGTEYSKLYLSSQETLCGVAEKYYETIKYKKDGNQEKFEATKMKCHPDPNIVDYFLCKKQGLGFMGSVGQVGDAQNFLAKHDIKQNDIFLFFGQFAKPHDTKKNKFIENDHHVIWGYLKVTEKLEPYTMTKEQRREKEKQNGYAWLKFNPHWNIENHKENKKAKNDCIYIGAEYGVFDYDENKLNLTKPYSKIGKWQFPKKIFKNARIESEKPIHNNEIIDGSFELAETYGQEFLILENGKQESPKAVIEWAEKLGASIRCM
jgi:hypothetical protein